MSVALEVGPTVWEWPWRGGGYDQHSRRCVSGQRAKMGPAQSSLVLKGNRAGLTAWSGLGGKTPKPTQLGSGFGWEKGGKGWSRAKVRCARGWCEREDGPSTVSVWFLEGRGRAQQCGRGLGGATAEPTQPVREEREIRSGGAQCSVVSARRGRSPISDCGLGGEKG